MAHFLVLPCIAWLLHVSVEFLLPFCTYLTEDLDLACRFGCFIWVSEAHTFAKLHGLSHDKGTDFMILACEPTFSPASVVLCKLSSLGSFLNAEKGDRARGDKGSTRQGTEDHLDCIQHSELHLCVCLAPAGLGRWCLFQGSPVSTHACIP